MLAWRLNMTDGDWWCQIKLFFEGSTDLANQVQSVLEQRFEMSGSPYISNEITSNAKVWTGDDSLSNITTSLDALQTRFVGDGQTLQQHIQEGVTDFEVTLQPDWYYFDNSTIQRATMVEPKNDRLGL